MFTTQRLLYARLFFKKFSRLILFQLQTARSWRFVEVSDLSHRLGILLTSPNLRTFLQNGETPPVATRHRLRWTCRSSGITGLVQPRPLRRRRRWLAGWCSACHSFARFGGTQPHGTISQSALGNHGLWRTSVAGGHLGCAVETRGAYFEKLWPGPSTPSKRRAPPRSAGSEWLDERLGQRFFAAGLFLATQLP